MFRRRQGWSVSKKHPAFWFSRTPLGFWHVRMDPEAQVDHRELEFSLQVAETYGLFNYLFRSRREAARALGRACRYHQKYGVQGQEVPGYEQDSHPDRIG